MGVNYPALRVGVTFSVSPFAKVLVAAVSPPKYGYAPELLLIVVVSVTTQLLAPLGEGAPENAPNVT